MVAGVDVELARVDKLEFFLLPEEFVDVCLLFEILDLGVLVLIR